MRKVDVITNNTADKILLIESLSKDKFIKFIYFEEDWAHSEFYQLRFIGQQIGNTSVIDFTVDEFSRFVSKLASLLDYNNTFVDWCKPTSTLRIESKNNIVELFSYVDEKSLKKNKIDWCFTIEYKYLEEIVKNLSKMMRSED